MASRPWRDVRGGGECDGFAPIQAEHGVHGHQVLRSIENPNDSIVTHTFDSREAASAFFRNA